MSGRLRDTRLGAILWAQARVMTNFRLRGAVAARLLAWAMALVWYGIWTAGAAALGYAASVAPPRVIALALPWALLGIFIYWQLAPIITASLGTTLDLRKLLVWPIPERSLFVIEVILRLSTAAEMVILLAAGTIGLARNHGVPAWAPASALPLYAAFNLFVAAGLRNLLERLFARKGLREALIFVVVLASALPQLVIWTGSETAAHRFLHTPSPVWPWAAFAALATGAGVLPAAPVALFWLMAAYAFGRMQFRHSLRFDMAAAGATVRPARERARWSDRLYRAPSALFGDPLGALVEKELRTLARSPRFRLVFLMGFSFGFIIWLPMLRDGSVGANYPVYVAGYGVLLMAEVVIWNSFGFDGGSARFYWAAPVSFTSVLVAKNIAAFTAVLFETAIIAVVCTLLPLGVPASKLFETLVVASLIAIYLTATGNLTSVHYPRAVNPEHSWGRTSGNRFQLVLLPLFPVLIAPVLLAYAARWAFYGSALAFYAVLAAGAGAGLIYYWVALDSAIAAADRRRDDFLAALGQSAGPLSNE